MAISYLSEVVKGSEYITPYDTDVVHKAFLYQQQQFDANVAKTQESINQLSSLDVISEEDKKYRDAMIQGLTNKTNSMAGMDFGKSSTMNMINQAKQAITNDGRLLNALQDTSAIRKKQAHQAELMKKGQYSDANMWEDAQADIAYLSAKKIDPNARYQGASYATPFKDVSKAYEKTALAVAKIKAQGHKQINLPRAVVNPDGSTTVVQETIDISGISDEELQSRIANSLPIAEQKQLAIDARYKYRDVTPEALLAESVASVSQKYIKTKNRLEELDKAVKQSVKGSAEEKRLTDEQASLSKVYNEQIKSRTAELANAVKSNPDSVKVSLYQDMLSGMYGSLYSNLSEKVTEDKAYYKAVATDLNADKFAWQREVQTEQIRQGQERIQQGNERIRQGDEALDLRRDTLDANIADDNADNTRADNKATSGTGTGSGSTGSGSTGGGTTGGVSTKGVISNTDTSSAKKKYSDFKAEGVALKEQEMQEVLSTIVEIAHDQDSSIFQNPELMKYLGAGKDSKINITGPDGKINPQVADKLGTYFDKIGLSGIVPKMQRYYEEIARGGHPDTFATFKDYMPLANALNIIKDKQKAHAAQDRVIRDGAIEMLHKEAGSKLPVSSFKFNVDFIERISNKIGSYQPSSAEQAKWGPLVKTMQEKDDSKTTVPDLVLTDLKNDLTQEGAKKLGIPEKQRVEYNRVKNQYDRNLLEKFSKAKNDYTQTIGIALDAVKQYTVSEGESKKDSVTSGFLRNNIISNPDKVSLIPTGESKPLVATDERIANITNVRVLEHTVQRNGKSTGRVEITYSETPDEDGKTTQKKYIASMALGNDIINSSQFRGGIAQPKEYQDIIDTIDAVGGRSSEQYLNYSSPNVKNPDPIAFVFERSPSEPKDNGMYLRVVVKDAKGNDIGFKVGGRGTPADLAKNLRGLIAQSMEKGLTKQEAIEGLRTLSNR